MRDEEQAKGAGDGDAPDNLEMGGIRGGAMSGSPQADAVRGSMDPNSGSMGGSGSRSMGGSSSSGMSTGESMGADAIGGGTLGDSTLGDMGATGGSIDDVSGSAMGGQDRGAIPGTGGSPMDDLRGGLSSDAMGDTGGSGTMGGSADTMGAGLGGSGGTSSGGALDDIDRDTLESKIRGAADQNTRDRAATNIDTRPDLRDDETGERHPM